jgi:hypothetical protein
MTIAMYDRFRELRAAGQIGPIWPDGHGAWLLAPAEIHPEPLTMARRISEHGLYLKIFKTPAQRANARERHWPEWVGRNHRRLEARRPAESARIA